MFGNTLVLRLKNFNLLYSKSFRNLFNYTKIMQCSSATSVWNHACQQEVASECAQCREPHHVRPQPSSPLSTGNPPATGTGTLLVTLEDVNDNAPVLHPTVAEVCDDAKNLSVVILGASDKDLHPNTDPFKFEIHKQTVPDKVWKISKINSKSI